MISETPTFFHLLTAIVGIVLGIFFFIQVLPSVLYRVIQNPEARNVAIYILVSFVMIVLVYILGVSYFGPEVS